MLTHASTAVLLLTLCCPPQAALKKYQMEHKSKGESLEKCQAELKKLRRKSQGSKHPSKYGDKEMQVSLCVCITAVWVCIHETKCLFRCVQEAEVSDVLNCAKYRWFSGLGKLFLWINEK